MTSPVKPEKGAVNVPWTPSELIEVLEAHARSADRYGTSYTETAHLCRDAAQTIRNMLEALKLVQIFAKGNQHPEDEDSWAWFCHGLMDKVNAAIAKSGGVDEEGLR